MSKAERIEVTKGLFVWRHGSGGDEQRTLVAFHGWSGDHRVYDPVAAYRPPNTTLLVFDQPGSGVSAPPRRWTMEEFIAPMLNALKELGTDRYTLVGNCAGAVVALEMMRAKPQAVERLVLIDPFAYVPWYFRTLTAPWLGRLFYYSTFANPFGRLITDLVLRKKQGERTSLTRGFLEAAHHNAFAHLTMLCRLRDVGRYASPDITTDILFGARSFQAVKKSVWMLRAVLPHGATFEIDSAGHLPIQEATASVAQSIFRARLSDSIVKTATNLAVLHVA